MRQPVVWRPFLGGDEDRNTAERLWETQPHRGVPSSEGTRIATRLVPDNVVMAAPWRPFLGGDEDRNRISAQRSASSPQWRPFLGGDEDRNHASSSLSRTCSKRGVPSSEGTRIATLR